MGAFDDIQPKASKGYFDDILNEPEDKPKGYFDHILSEPDVAPSSIARQGLADPALMTVTGIANVGKGVLSLGALGADLISEPARRVADAITGREHNSAPVSGLLAKGLEASGANKFTKAVKDLYSPEQKAASAAASAVTAQSLEKAKSEGAGALGQIGAEISGTAQGVWENPRAAVPLIVENIPQLAGMVGTTKALLANTIKSVSEKVAAGTLTKAAGDALIKKAAQKVSTAVEGGFVTGSVANEINEVDPNADLLHRAAAIPAGVVSTAISRATGRLTGLDNIEGQLAVKGLTGPTAGRLASMGKSAVSEGVLQEPWQEGQEQAWTNVGTGRPIQEGVGEGVVYGAIAGVGTGGTAGLVTSTGKPRIDPAEAVLKHIESKDPTPVQLVALRNSPEQLSRIGLTPEHIDTLLVKHDSDSVERARFQNMLDTAPNKAARDGLLSTALGQQFTAFQEAERVKAEAEKKNLEMPHAEALEIAEVRRDELANRVDLTPDEAVELDKLNKAGVNPFKLGEALGRTIVDVPESAVPPPAPRTELLHSEAIVQIEQRIAALGAKSFRTTNEKKELRDLSILKNDGYKIGEVAKTLKRTIQKDPKKPADVVSTVNMQDVVQNAEVARAKAAAEKVNLDLGTSAAPVVEQAVPTPDVTDYSGSITPEVDEANETPIARAKRVEREMREHALAEQKTAKVAPVVETPVVSAEALEVQQTKEEPAETTEAPVTKTKKTRTAHETVYKNFVKQYSSDELSSVNVDLSFLETDDQTSVSQMPAQAALDWLNGELEIYTKLKRCMR